MKKKRAAAPVPSLVSVSIPTAQEFLAQWHDWVAWKVSKCFKKNKERIPEFAQRARLRLLQKEFVSRWFFDKLTNDLVDLPQAMVILGGAPVTFIGKIRPVHGHRTDPASLWRVSDLLNYARFDYERYFYSIQGHTIDSNRVLRLLGYGSLDPATGEWVVSPSDYGALESLYRQGRLKPSELTEHECVEVVSDGASTDGCSHSGCGKKHYSRGYCSAHYHLSRTRQCLGCVKGREALRAAGVSLVKRWSDPEVAKIVEKLRWNDRQLAPFLREWKRSNMVKCPPKYIMRPRSLATVEAGLKKYAFVIVKNDVNNHFKSMRRSDDLALTVFDHLDPEMSDADSIGWESDGDNDEFCRVFRDNSSVEEVRNSDRRHDIQKIMDIASLSDVEIRLIEQLDLSEVPAADVSESEDIPLARIHSLHRAALEKMRLAAESIGLHSA